MTSIKTHREKNRNDVHSLKHANTYILMGVLLFGVCLAAVIIPVLTTSIYPMTDYPVHLMLLDAAASGDNCWETQWFTPYSMSFLAGSVCTALCSPLTAGKILLIFYFLGTPLAFIWLIKNSGSPLAYSFVIFPLLYNFNVSWGFLPFLVSMPVFMAGLAAVMQWLRQTSAAWLCTGAAFLLILFFTHLFTWMIATALITVLVLLGSTSIKQRILGIVCFILPSSILATAWYSVLKFSAADHVFLDKGIRFPPMNLKFRFFPDYVMSGYADAHGMVLFWLLCLSLLILAAGAWKYRKPRNQDRSHRLRWIIPAVMLAIYLTCPYSMLTAVWLFNRIAWLTVALLVMAIPASSQKIFSSGFVLATVLITLCLSIQTTNVYMNFQEEASGAIHCMARLPQGEALRFLPLSTRSRFTDHTPYDHIDAYYAVLFRGKIHNPFAVLTHMPIKYNSDKMMKEAAYTPAVQRVGNKLEFHPQPERHRFFLVRGQNGSPRHVLPAVFGDTLRYLQVVCEQDDWMLLERTGDGIESRRTETP